MLKVECDRWNESASVQQKQTHSSRWTLKRLVAWINEQFNLKCCRESVRKTLQNLGFSGKKARKILNKANTKKRREYLEKLKGLLDDTLDKGRLLIFIDEAHIHLDCDEGNGWSVKGERFWVSSNSPGRTKVSFYGVYVYNYAQVKIFPYLKADQFNSIDVLKNSFVNSTFATSLSFGMVPLITGRNL